MNIYVFVGPTLPVNDARQVLDATYLPPVSQGDVYRATMKNPDAIGIIDGIFQHVPSVWHKEILWAIKQGVPVYGSASMGALRAAELYPFGMRGVGTIFESYRDGTFEDDDEVAVATAAGEPHSPALSEAMVNIRLTLESAHQEGIISAQTRLTLVRLIKDVPFPLRTYSELLRLGRSARVDPQELIALDSWLPRGRIDQKRDDALAMLVAMRTSSASGGQHPSSDFPFEHTEFFERFRSSATEQLLERETDAPGSLGTVSLDDLLNELRLHPQWNEEIRAAARLRCLSLREARRLQLEVSAGELIAEIDHFRSSRGMLEPQDTSLWLSLHNMTPSQLRSLLRDERAIKRIEELIISESDLAYHMRAVLQVNGHYQELAARAYNKERFLSAVGLSDAAGLTDDISEAELVRWYFTQRLGAEQPRDVADHAKSMGFGDKSAFLTAVRREYWYDCLSGHHDSSVAPLRLEEEQSGTDSERLDVGGWR